MTQASSTAVIPCDHAAVCPQRSAPILILGGGPAGSAAGCLLARLGHAVRIAAKRSAAAPSLGESLPPSTGKLFEPLGLAGAMAEGGFVRSTGNTAWWGGTPPRVERFAEGGLGWQVDALALEHGLQAAARAAGATVAPPAPSHPRTPASPSFVLDCTGRAGVLARANDLRRYEDGPRTVALVGAWRRRDAWPVPDATHTLIESYAGGWAWSVPLASGQRQVAVMVDPQRSGLARGAGARDVYLAELARTRELGPLVRDGVLVGGPWGWDASTYHATQYAGDGWLLVGDAGATIDPLSSAGVKKALASGWLAAIVVHTALGRPAMRAAALQFFEAREREVCEAYRALSRRHLAAAAQGHPDAFWLDRSDDGPGPEVRLQAGTAGARAAFERIRQAGGLGFARHPGLRIEPRPAVSGFEIVLEPRIVTDDEPRGVRFVADVDVVALADLAPGAADVAGLFDRYCRRVAPVSLPDFLRALATAVDRGWLVAQ